jgi:EcoRII C terminal
MKKGLLSEYFDGVAVKTLTIVDAEPKKSNQHEVGTTKAMRSFLTERFQKFEATYVLVTGEQEAIQEYGSATMYDSREKKAHRPPEWRLYYDSNAITDMMQPSDTLFIAKLQGQCLLFIVVPKGSDILHQLLWLFGFDSQPEFGFAATEFKAGNDSELDFAARLILDEIGIEFEDPNANDLDEIIRRYGSTMPKTYDFSKLARDTLRDVDAIGHPDLALMAWLDHEEALFRRLERKIVSERIIEGFATGSDVDVDGFIKFSLSVQNRRKSRMGHSFEHHLAALLDYNKIAYAHPGRTERGNKPDFIFPSQAAYSDPDFLASKLVMLAAKSVCKERWRQILPEADRIDIKHLVTIEPGISEAQTEQMRSHSVQLIVPERLHTSYSKNQRTWIWSVSNFLTFLLSRQIS